MESGAENIKHVSTPESTLWQLCCVILKVVEIYSCQKVAKTLKTCRARSASITLLWNKSWTNWLLLPLPRSIFGSCNLPCLVEAPWRSNERAADRQLFLQELEMARRNMGRRGGRQSAPSALYTGGLMWWSYFESGVNNDRCCWI